MCFSSGNTLLNPLAFAVEPRRAASVRRPLATLAVKYCVYSTSLSVLAECNGTSMDLSSAVLSSRVGGGCCSVAERWWLVAGRRNEGRSDTEG